MSLITQYFVNRKTRYCLILQGRGNEQDEQVSDALRDGYVEVTESEQAEFSAETWKARDAGWKHDGRVSYTRFMRGRTL